MATSTPLTPPTLPTPPAVPIPNEPVPPGTPTATDVVTTKYSSALDGSYTPATTQTIAPSDASAAYSSALTSYSSALTSYSSALASYSKATVTSTVGSSQDTTTPTIATSSHPTISTSTPLKSLATTNPNSSATSTSSGTSAPPSTNPAAAHSSGDGLSNGTVAGIVVGVAVGLALITFLATFLAMRRRRGSGAKSNRGVLDTGNMGQHYQDSEPKGPSVTETPSGSASFEKFLPQSADDKTVQNGVKTTLDQIELHVENFYQNASASGARPADAELATFNSPYLPSPLAALLPQTNNRVLLIKHALAQFITSCISATASPDWSLLPEDFVLLPSAIRSASSSKSTKPGEYYDSLKEQPCIALFTYILKGFSQSMSRWRVLTAYLRPNPSDDTSYIAQRDHQINEMVQVFSRAFAPWQNPKYKDEDRVRSLSAILKDAAGLGIWMFSQPSDLQFQWPRNSEVGANRIAVAPALVKLTDERGQSLSEPQVMIKMAAQKV